MSDQVEKNEALAYATQDKVPQTEEFTHNGELVVVKYFSPSVEQINRARKKYSRTKARGNTVEFDVQTDKMELDLVHDALVETNIPGIPEGGKSALKNIRDWELWQKLLKACDVVKRTEPHREDLEAAAQEVVSEVEPGEYISVERLKQALEPASEEEDIKNSSKGGHPETRR